MDSRHIGYFALMKERPELFNSSELIDIETEYEKITAFEKESGIQTGILYKSRFSMLVVDVIKGKNGYYTYERIIPAATGKGVVVIPKYNGKFLLIRQYRHTIRDYQYCFVRGFGEDGISPEANALKEISEEIGGKVTSTTYLGELTPDSGITSNIVSYFVCELSSYDKPESEEGIDMIIELDQTGLEEWIKTNRITDGYSVCAYGLYKLKGLA